MRPSGRVSSSCIRIGLYQGFVGVHEEEMRSFFVYWNCPATTSAKVYVMARTKVGHFEYKFGIFSFFSGAGFLDLGFETTPGYKVLMANEIAPSFARVYSYARERAGMSPPKFGLQNGDVCAYADDETAARELRDKVNKARAESELVGFIGGPPCPDFSVAGKQAGATGKHGRLSQVYVDVICEQRPDFFVFENVKGLWRTAKHREFFDRIVAQLRKAGYATTTRLINALEYGAPQDRERIILIGVKSDLLNAGKCGQTELTDYDWSASTRFTMEDVNAAEWPTTDAFAVNGARKRPPGVIDELTVEHWFAKNDVDHHPNANDFFVPRAGLPKMMTFAEGDDSRKCYKRLHRFRYSPTACYGNNEVHLHPYKARRLSVAEALAIQSLPAWFVLPGDVTLSDKFKTIGNGVPYLAAKGIAEALADYLNKNAIRQNGAKK